MKELPAHFNLSHKRTLQYYAKVLSIAEESEDEAEYDRVRKQLAENDLYFLLSFILNRSEIIPKKWIFERCREFQRNPNGHLDLWAREHYKSTVITFAGTIFEIINDPEITIGIFSHTKSIARDFVRQIKEELETNELLPRLWPDIFYEDPPRQSKRWSIDNGFNVKRDGNPKEATVEGHGLVDGMPTGRHFKLRVYDDVVTIESVSTPEQIEKTTYAWQMSDNLGSEGGWERYIGTRYHLFDTYATMIDNKAVIPRVHPATVDGTESGEPVLLTEETLRDKRVKQGPYVFSSQMLLNPVADKAMGFLREWLVYGDTDFEKAMNQLWRFIIVDPAGGKQRKDNDYTTMWVIGHGADGKFRVLDCVRDRLRLTQRASTLIDLHNTWKPSFVAYEEIGMQADLEHIKQEQERLMYEFDIYPLGGNMPKKECIKRLVPYFENGYVPVSQGGEGIPKSRIILPHRIQYTDYNEMTRNLISDFVEQEYVAFPVLSHDDMIDSLARIVELEEKGLIEKPTISTPKSRKFDLQQALSSRNKVNTGENSFLTV